jgi:hypothetical protein
MPHENDDARPLLHDEEGERVVGDELEHAGRWPATSTQAPGGCSSLCSQLVHLNHRHVRNLSQDSGTSADGTCRHCSPP